MIILRAMLNPVYLTIWRVIAGFNVCAAKNVDTFPVLEKLRRRMMRHGGEKYGAE